MVAEVRLPPLGQTSDEMSIVEWYKNEGDRIEIAEPLLCVETDKAQVDVESAEEGVVLRIVAQPGELLASGSLLAYVGAPGEEIPGESDAAPADEASAASAVPTPTPAAPATTPSGAAASSPPPPPPPAPAPTGRVQASPVVRKLAADLGVDLSTIVGSGPGGIVERADVQKAADAARAPAPEATSAPTPAAAEESRSSLVDVPPLRRIIARRLIRSTQTIPTFRITAHLDASAARRSVEAYGTGLTYTHLVLRAVARALRDHPVMLRLWVEDGPKYRVLADPNVGLAVAGEDSLYVVTIPSPDEPPIPALIETVAEAAKRGRAGALSKQDQSPASITVSNLGMFAVDDFDAIIDPDQNAILAVSSVQDRVVAVDGAPTVVPQLTVTLSCDHRSVDGAQAARFLRTLREYFESDPAA